MYAIIYAGLASLIASIVLFIIVFTGRLKPETRLRLYEVATALATVTTGVFLDPGLGLMIAGLVTAGWCMLYNFYDVRTWPRCFGISSLLLIAASATWLIEGAKEWMPLVPAIAFMAGVTFTLYLIARPRKRRIL
mgnify:CR=1 FL=1